MGDYERILAAYLFLCALEKTGTVVENFDIHKAWLGYCSNQNRNMAESELLAAAQYAGFQL